MPGAFRSPAIPLPVELLVPPALAHVTPSTSAVVCSHAVTREQHESASRRLLATAMSRARHAVVFSSVVSRPGRAVDAVLDDDGSGVASSGSGRNVKRSRWLEGIFRGVAIDSGTVAAPTHEPPRTPTVPVLTPAALPVDSASHSAAAVAAAMVQRLELSFSSLFDYQWCPHRYYLRKVVKLPSFPSPAMSYGKGSSGVIGR